MKVLQLIIALVLYRKRNEDLRENDFYQCMWVKKKKQIGPHVSLATLVAHLATHQTTLKLCPVAAGHKHFVALYPLTHSL